jgi:hypothetical protein
MAGYPFLLFISLIFISIFSDDTFSSFTGAVFFSYFYTLLIAINGDHET